MQGLLTNDVTLLEKPNPRPLYSCILNPQGRFLHDLFLHPLSSLPTDGAPAAVARENGSPTVLLDTDSHGKSDLVRLLKRYRLREKIEIDDVSEDWHVWTQFGSRVASPSSTTPSTSAPRWPVDPRLPSLGYRTLLKNTSSTAKDNSITNEVVPWEAYRRWRISLGVAEGDEEIPSGEAIALEYNIDQAGLDGISFTKGCYVGQELMARTHFKGVVRKRLMPVDLKNKNIISSGGCREGSGGDGDSDDENSSSGSTAENNNTETAHENIVDKETGKVLGSLRVVDSETQQGLALLRLKEAQEAIDGGRILQTEHGRVEIMPRRPEWWPQSWGREG
jgi:folate-binding protein YgfZ